MTKRKDGGPAFPTTPDNETRLNGDGGRGMTLRDWFAGQALMSMLTEPSKISDSAYDRAAELSYRFADAMLAAAEKEKGG